jgi:dipeptidyl-peptidase 4
MKRTYRIMVIAALVLLGVVQVTMAEKKKLTYRMTSGRGGGDHRLLQPLPTIEGWLDDAHYLERKSDDKGQAKLNSVSAVDGKVSVFFDFEAWKDKPAAGFSIERALQHSNDYVHFLFNKDNDLYYYNTRSGIHKRLTNSSAAEQTPRFSPNYQYVAYTREHNLYVVDVASATEKQLTQDGSEVILNGYNSWIYYEEVYDRSYSAFWWSPNSERIAFIRYDDSPVPVFTLCRADGIHGQLETAHYPKAGDLNPFIKLGVIQVQSGSTVWIGMDEKADHYLAYPCWSQDSQKLFFQWMNRAQDRLLIYAADPATGVFKAVYEEKQDSWVDFFNDLYVLENGSGFILHSDKSGWPHLYYHDLAGSLKSVLTAGEWAVKSISFVDEKNGLVYFLAARPASTEMQLCRVRLNGKDLRVVTPEAGNHSARVSSAGSFIVDTYSSIQQPSRMVLRSRDGKVIRSLGDANTPALAEYALGKVELLTIPTSDGVTLPAVWVLPPDMEAGKKYPVLFSVYGGPGGRDVSNSFQRLSSHYLAQNGIICFTVDHRGSSHFGKKGVARMHRHLGKWEMNDYIEAVQWLRRQPFVDSTRMAITGGSYGGYVTCLALTYAADYFTHGIAEFSVTDYRLYDSIYTERYMDTPQENPSGYDSTSVMKWADRYKGLLRVTHGTMDDNVHMQNTIQLIDKLQDANKHFELMLYPNGRHGYGFTKYRHAGEESMRFWFKHLLNREWSSAE